MQSILGESACLTAALMWAVAVVLFRGPIAAWGARTANLVKCLVATALLALTLPFFGGLSAFMSVPVGAAGGGGWRGCPADCGMTSVGRDSRRHFGDIRR